MEHLLESIDSLFMKKGCLAIIAVASVATVVILALCSVITPFINSIVWGM